MNTPTRILHDALFMEDPGRASTVSGFWSAVILRAIRTTREDCAAFVETRPKNWSSKHVAEAMREESKRLEGSK